MPIEVGGPGQIVVVRVTERMELAPLMRALELACARTSGLVVVDCTGLDYITHHVIKPLVRACIWLNKRGFRLRLVHVSPTVERDLKTVRLWKYFQGHSAGDPLDEHIGLALTRTDDADQRITFAYGRVNPDLDPGVDSVFGLHEPRDHAVAPWRDWVQALQAAWARRGSGTRNRPS